MVIKSKMREIRINRGEDDNDKFRENSPKVIFMTFQLRKAFLTCQQVLNKFFSPDENNLKPMKN